jgi:methionyl-tRNA formyltransferase
MSSESAAAASLGRIIFVGAVHEAVPALASLLSSPVDVVGVVTLPADHAGRTSGYVDLEPLAAARGVAVTHCADINSAASVARIRNVQPDLLVVVGWTRLLSAELLAVPRRGSVGFHASLLPRYRGRAPVNWAILRGDTVTGNTMMYLDAGTDTGDVVDQVPVPIQPDDTCATVYAKVGAAGADLLRRHVAALLAGTAPRRAQPAPADPPLPKRTPRMGITDWNRSPRQVHDWIRALTQPYPGAFTYCAGRKIMLWESAIPARPPGGGPPGRVLACDESGLQVGTADGSLLVSSLSDEGDSPEPALSWARRNGLDAGDRFDPVDPATARWALGLGPEPAGATAGRS